MLRKFCALLALSFVVLIVAGTASLYPYQPSLNDLAITVHSLRLQLLALLLCFFFAIAVISSSILLEKDPDPSESSQKQEPTPETAKEKPVEKVVEKPVENVLEKPVEKVSEKPVVKPEPEIVAPKVTAPEPAPLKPVEAEKPPKIVEDPPKPLAPPPDPLSPPPVAYQILFMFQKEGRLLDFLMEDITGLDDETLGGAIRPIHEGCRNILKDRLVIEPVLSDAEGSDIKFAKNVNPSEIKLTGNVPPEAPYRGVVVHRGWRLKECHLPQLVDGWSGKTVAPAEVEIS